MGQAVVDLPDPLEKQPASASSADDLLAQLAGDEIDRLLTEADVESEATGKAAMDAATPITEPLAASRAEAASTTQAAAPAKTESKTVPAPIATKEETPSITAVAAKSDSTDEKDKSTPAVESGDAEADLDAVLRSSLANPPAPDAAVTTDLDQTLAAEAEAIMAPHKAELQAEAGDTGPAEANERENLLAHVAAESTDEDVNAPLPIWLRPLEWLNAPLEALSDEARSFLGKAAILTLVNSAAVIAYVLIFRRS